MAMSTDHENTKRVLYHLVKSYQTWRDSSIGVPNELTDDAVRIGERHLRDVDWFPENEGWLAHSTNSTPLDGAGVNSLDVLALINAELDRLKDETWHYKLAFWEFRQKRWREGVIAARRVAAESLQNIKNAYVVESLTKEAERLDLYDTQE